jgi:hypothetical protein
MTEEETDWEAFTNQLCRKIIILEKEVIDKLRGISWSGDSKAQALLVGFIRDTTDMARKLKTKDPIVRKEDLYSLETKELVEAFWNHHEGKIEELEKENERLRLQISKKLI